MTRKCLLIMSVSFYLTMAIPALSEAVLKFGSVKVFPPYYLAAQAAEEKGLWKQNGIEVEWLPFRSSSPQLKATAAGVLQFGLVPSLGVMVAIGNGVPAMIIGDYSKASFFFWVRTDSRFKKPEDLKGAKIGVTRLGGSSHAYARLVTKALGIQQEIRFVGTGGIRQDIAALRARATDASVMGLGIMLRVKLAGEIRELVNVSDYLPKNWLDHVIYAHSDFARKQPGQLKSAVRAILEASAFIKKNPRWAKDKMRAMSGYTQGQAEFMFKNLGLTSDGAVRNETVEKIRAFAIEYDLITKEKTPPVAKFFTTRFLP